LIRGLLISIRPQQWVKNTVVLAAVIFSGRLEDPDALVHSLGVLVAFCLGSGGNYLLNDLLDLEADRLHPRKRGRPIAAGTLPVRVAAIAAVVLEIGAVALAFALGTEAALFVLGYLVLMGLYSVSLKRWVLVDVFAIAAGFLIRVMAGAAVITVPVSSWLILCTIFLSLFLGFGKRRAELTLLEGASADHREALAEYTVPFLDQIIAVCTASVVTCYTLYTVSGTIGREAEPNMVFTVPFVIFGIFRYLFLLHRRDGGGSPTRALLRDMPTLLNVLLWLATVVVVLY
jgi:4-hydroxybenzoate polyprenyltransferase